MLSKTPGPGEMVRAAPVWPRVGGAIEEETRPLEVTWALAAAPPAMGESTILPDMARGMAVEPTLGSGGVASGLAGVTGTLLLAVAAGAESLPRHAWLMRTVAVAATAGTVLRGTGWASLSVLL